MKRFRETCTNEFHNENGHPNHHELDMGAECKNSANVGHDI